MCDVAISLISQQADQFTGTARYTHELIRELSQGADSLRVRVIGRAEVLAPMAGVIGSQGELIATSTKPPPQSRVVRAVSLISPLDRQRALIRRQFARADVVHFPLTLIVPSTPRPTVVTLHDVLHHDRPSDFTRLQLAWRRFLYDGAASRADHVITVSEHARVRIVERLGIAEKHVHVVYHGIDLARFQSQDHAQDARIAQGLKLPERYLFFPASLWPHKNHLTLLKALAASGLQDVSLVLSGATFGRLDNLQIAARRLGLSDRLRHLGFIPDEALPTVYRRAVGLVFPSLYEGFGIPPLEAMACGCVVASSRRGALREVCGDAVVDLDPLSVEQMAEAIRVLSTEIGLRSALRERGFVQAKQFSWARSAAGHRHVYRLAAAGAL